MRVALVPLAAVVALALSAGAGAQGTTTLNGTVGPGFTIRLVDASSGTSVRHLDPGSYTINVVDKSPEHNFHLTGPGVDKASEVEATVEETGTLTWNVTFQDGRYHFQCDPHSNTRFGDFTVGAATPPPTTTTTTPPPPRPSAARLAASVGPGERIAVTRAGAKVKVVTLKRGAAVLVVRDLSATDNFHLVGPGVNRQTTRAGKGTFTWRLALKAGIYRYRSDATAALKGSFRVTA
jgi:plastocyanin